VVDAGGRVRAAWGEADAPTFPRSAIKAIQALPLIETGAAEAFAVSEPELALAASSHSAEPVHVQAVARWLRRLGLDADDLECGPHPPIDRKAAEALVREGSAPARTHNNCSGKHTGFLTVARHLGVPTKGYTLADHPVQRLVTRAIAEMTEVDVAHVAVGVDGCGIPTLGLPLSGLARAMARIADPSGLPESRVAAIGRLRKAIAAHPLLYAGTGRFTTRLLGAVGDRLFVKSGAEGVFAAAIPAQGLGVALKVEDGAGRANEVAMLHLLRWLGAIDAATMEGLGPVALHAVTNTQGKTVGEVRAASAWLG
jgi:L-asparaginase II